MSDPTDLAELLASAPHNWGRWGPDDEVGSLNHLDAAQVLRGVAAVRSGRVCTLQRLIGDPAGDPVWPGRPQPSRRMHLDESKYEVGFPEMPGGAHSSDDSIRMSLQGSTQYDALGHVWHSGRIWNDRPASTTNGEMRFAGVDPIARRGVIGRGILLDLAGHLGVDAVPAGTAFDLADLLAYADRQGVTIEKHDILLLRTNHLALFDADPEAFFADFCEPGLAYSPELVDWFAERGIPNLVTDTIGNEITTDPRTGFSLTLHNALMRNLGVAFTELCDFSALIEACRETGRWEFLYAAAPLRVHGATGSPVNPIAVL